MGKGRERQVVMMMGIVMLMSTQMVPSSAQECWDRIVACNEGGQTRAEFQQECCDSFVREITDERECFCTIRSTIAGNATLLRDMNSLLSLCSVTQSFNTLCPGRSASSPPSLSPSSPVEDDTCWSDIVKCRRNNRNRRETEPHLDPSSPTFNVTEYLCCPLMQQKAALEKDCFCDKIHTFLQENPSGARNVTLLLSACDIILNSVTALNNFCPAETPSTASAPPQLLSLLAGGAVNSNQPPTLPTRGSMEDLRGLSFVFNSKTPGNN